MHHSSLTLIATITSISISSMNMVGHSAEEATKLDLLAPDFKAIPPAPTVQQMMKFEEIPVDYFHGIPNVSIPILTVHSNGLSFPITLNYHGGGHKVDRESGVLGYSWELAASACVARTVYGLPDDLRTGTNSASACGLMHLTSDDNEFRNHIISRNDADISTPLLQNNFINNHQPIVKKGIRYYCGKCDMATDLYHIAGAGLSGTFAYGDDRNIVLSSPSAITIRESRLTGTTNEFNIYSTDCKMYKFAACEYTQGEWDFGNPLLNQGEETYKTKEKYISAWHLTEIANLNGDTIKFHYVQPSQAAHTYDSEKYLNAHDPRVYDEGYTNFSCSSTSVIYYPQLISRIESRDAIVTFNYSTVPTNSRLLPHLQYISVFSPSDPAKEVKRITFGYGNGELCSVTENDEMLYEIAYYPLDLKYTGKDFGGYYNGTGGGSGVPFVDKYIGGGKADRRVNPNMAADGNIKSIRHPTGAETKFVWESNRVSNLPDLNAGDDIKEIVKTFDHYLRYRSDDASECVMQINNLQVTSITKVQLDLTRYFCFDHAYLQGTEYTWQHNASNKTYPRVEFTKVVRDNEKPYVKTFFLDKATIEDTFRNQPQYIDLPEGTYTVRLLDPIAIYDPAHLDFAEYFDASRGWDSGWVLIKLVTTKSYSGDKGNCPPWPGVRIQRISYIPNDETEPIHKDYYYDEVDREYGQAQHLPEFNYHYYGVVPRRQLLGDLSFEVDVVTDCGLPNSPLGGNEIEYPHVKVRYTEGRHDTGGQDKLYHYHGENYYYTSLLDRDNRDVSETPLMAFQPPSARMFTSRGHRRGALTRQSTEQLGQSYTDTEYEYILEENDDTPHLTTDLFFVTDFTHSSMMGELSSYYVRDYFIGKYRIIPYRRLLSKEKHTEKADNTPQVTDSIVYEYYAPDHQYSPEPLRMFPQRLLKSRTEWDAEGNKVITYFTYRHVTHTVGTNESHKFWIPTPETEITVIGGTNPHVIKAIRRWFERGTSRLDKTYTSADPASITFSNTTTPSTPTYYQSQIADLEYSYRYDKNGNIIEILYRNVPVVSYLWGYNAVYPVVEAREIGYDELLATLSSAGVSTNEMSKLEGITSARWTSILATVRNLKPRAELSRLTYSPLIGILSATDAAGVTTTYNYDERGRLIDIKDFNNYLIERYEYHYKLNP